MPETPDPDPQHATADALRAAAWSGLWTFLGTFALFLLGWLADVARWASSSGRQPLPGLSTVGYAAVSAFVAGAVLIVAAIVRIAQARGLLPGRPPRYR